MRVPFWPKDDNVVGTYFGPYAIIHHHMYDYGPAKYSVGPRELIPAEPDIVYAPHRG